MSLREAGYVVTLTREPGGTAFGQQIRDILLDPSNNLSKATELFLFLADRAQNYKEVIKPSLKAGHVVISDRYFDSTLVYQGAGRGWKSGLLWRLHHVTTGSLLPDLTIVLDGVPHIDRQAERPDRIEAENQTFFERVRGAMLHQASKEKRYAIVNANVDIATLGRRILDIIHERELLELVELEGEGAHGVVQPAPTSSSLTDSGQS